MTQPVATPDEEGNVWGKCTEILPFYFLGLSGTGEIFKCVCITDALFKHLILCYFQYFLFHDFNSTIL